ncbi:MAG TPA: undecaprenyl-diphosphate phosphatase [Methanoregula sp.]|nr:undecaprenyl-diphosphate phosphatase [Methanoregula sp.]
MIETIQAVILGIIQGITAWIPVSSKTQVILFGKVFFNLDFMTAVSFALIVHIGDLIATLFLFRNEIAGFFKIKPEIADLKAMESADPERSLFWFVAISVFFSGAVGLPLYLSTKKGFSDLPGTLFLALVGMTLVVLGLFMWSSSRKNGGKSGSKLKKRISLTDTIITGCAQGLAVIPGISRSGITESTLLIRGYTPYESVRLSFFMSIPMIALSICTFFFIEGFGTLTLPVIVLGIVAAFIASIVTMRVMLYAAEKVRFYYFNIAIGLLAMVPFVCQLILG